MRPPRVSVRVDGRELEGVTVIVQNCDPYTYFGRRPIRINEGAALGDGTLGVTVLKRATVAELPTVAWRAFPVQGGRRLHRGVRAGELCRGAEGASGDALGGRAAHSQPRCSESCRALSLASIKGRSVRERCFFSRRPLPPSSLDG